MMTCAEIRANAAALATLPVDHPERLQAVSHAMTCADCAFALRQAATMIRTLDKNPGRVPSSPAAARRASAALLAELSGPSEPPPPPALARPVTFTPAAVMAMWALPLGMSRQAVVGSGALLASAGLALLASLSAGLTIVSGNLMAGLFPVISVGFSIVSGTDARAALDPAVGAQCAFVELLGAIGALILVYAGTLVFTRRLPMERAVVAGAAGGGAMAGQAALNQICPTPAALPHMLVFHSGTVALVALLALLVGFLIPVSPRRPQ